MKPKHFYDPIHLDDGRFPAGNMQRNAKKYSGRIRHARFSPPTMGPQQIKGVYEVCQYMNSLEEVTPCFRDNRKFI